MNAGFLAFLLVLGGIAVVLTAILIATGGQSEEGRRRQ